MPLNQPHGLAVKVIIIFTYIYVYSLVQMLTELLHEKLEITKQGIAMF